ncbi:MAG: type II toxin-antitoxin system HigB family toxin [Sedimentisphaerales bacterium]|nr:type II toxin-antitoxin system HigB family toxin [Sedimentisphaerales bacterium]
MLVLGKDKLQDFWNKHNQAKKPLERWLSITENTNWDSWPKLKLSFPSADMVEAKSGNNYVVFDIGGNKYRLVTEIDFSGTLVIVEVVMTHPEYSKDKWKDKL